MNTKHKLRLLERVIRKYGGELHQDDFDRIFASGVDRKVIVKTDLGSQIFGCQLGDTVLTRKPVKILSYEKGMPLGIALTREGQQKWLALAQWYIFQGKLTAKKKRGAIYYSVGKDEKKRKGIRNVVGTIR